MPEEIKVIEDKAKSFYQELEAEGAPHVTTLTGQLDKSTPLMYWAAGLSFDYVKDLFLDPLRVAVHKKSEDEIFRIINQFYDQEIGHHYKRAKSYHREKSKEAKDIGTYVHEAAEAIFRAMLENSPLDIPIDEDIKKPVEALLKWIADNDVTPVFVEKKVGAVLLASDFGEQGTPEISFIGRLDLKAYVNGKLTIIDHKAAKGIYNDAPLQVAAYDYASNFMIENNLLEGQPSEGSAILRLDKETGMPEYVEYSRDQTDDNFHSFSLLCAYWHMDKQRKENERFRKEDQREREKEEKKAIVLKAREDQAIVLKLGLFGNKEHTFKEIAELLEVSAQRARQIFNAGVRKVGNSIEHPLKIHLEGYKEEEKKKPKKTEDPY